MKKLLLGFTFLLSMGAFAQTHNYPPPTLEGAAQWQSFTYYACDATGIEIKNPYNLNYKKYDLEIWVPLTTEPWHVVSLYKDRVKEQICQFGKITEYHEDLIKIKKITRSPLLITPKDVDNEMPL